MLRKFTSAMLLLMSAACVNGCGDDDEGPSEAQLHGVGAACSSDAECTEPGQKCLSFKGGYCGVEGCKASTECPAGSACVAHTDGKTYCFLICVEKVDCNWGRPVEVESNCSSNITFTDSNKGSKACVPPS